MIGQQQIRTARDKGKNMAEDLMRYDLLAQDALRSVVHLALKRVQESGLPGEHHFFIAVSLDHPGVRVSDRLRQKYDNEMTIVLQHQFWNLEVFETFFEVELSFDNTPERLVVPYAAVKGFFDPSVQFGLQFEVAGEESSLEADADANSPLPVEDDKLEIPEGLKNRKKSEDAEDIPEATPKQPSNDDSTVVSLDSFRKK